MAVKVITWGRSQVAGENARQEDPRELSVDADSAYASVAAVVAPEASASGEDMIGLVYDDTIAHGDLVEGLTRLRERVIEGKLP